MLYPLSEKSIKKAKFFVYDIEALSKVENTTFRMLGFYTEDGYKYFLKIEDFLKYILKEKNAGYYIYAHYGGKYDVLFILENWYEHKGEFIKWKLDKIIDTGGRIIGITFVKLKKIIVKGKVKYRKLTITFADSYSLFMVSLDVLAKSFGLKGKDAHDHAIDFVINKENVLYNMHDCEILYKCLDIFYNKYANGIGCKLTIASCAMAVFRKFFQDENILGMEKNVEDFIRRSYAGGRTEIFKMKTEGDEQLKNYDINSMYPYCMRTAMPTGVAIFSTTMKKNKIGFYDTEVEVDNSLKIPLLYLKYKGLKFPTGIFEGIYDSEEIKEALKNKKNKVKIINGFYFLKKSILFKKYVDYYYALKSKSKKEKNYGGYLISKFFLNSLYGKFAQRRDKDVIVYCDNYKEAKERKLDLYNEDLGLWKKLEISKSKHIIPSISAHITALGRLRLYKFLLLCGDELFYCDTDSVYTTKTINVSEKMGEMKLEKYAKNVRFILPKTYVFDEVSKEGKFIRHYEILKGFDKGLKIGDLKLLGFKSAISCIGNVDSDYKFLKHGMYNKKINAVYSKRNICDNSFDTFPLNFGPEDFIKRESKFTISEEDYEKMSKEEQYDLRMSDIVENFGIKDMKKISKFKEKYSHWSAEDIIDGIKGIT